MPGIFDPDVFDEDIFDTLFWRIVEGIVTLQFASKERILDFADKVTTLKFGRKET